MTACGVLNPGQALRAGSLALCCWLSLPSAACVLPLDGLAVELSGRYAAALVRGDKARAEGLREAFWLAHELGAQGCEASDKAAEQVRRIARAQPPVAGAAGRAPPSGGSGVVWPLPNPVHDAQGRRFNPQLLQGAAKPGP